MVKTQKRISGGLDVLQYYTTRSWDFRNNNLRSIPEWLSPHDRKIFFIDVTKINWDDYMKDYILGAREFCCKEDPATIPRARILLKR